MAKDRNTFAKRQREADKKRKADQKRERRAKQKQSTGASSEASQSQSSLSADEQAVLREFRKYLMTPGKMLCLASADVKKFESSLADLIDKELLVEEQFPGGYSLTEAGFSEMKDGT